MWLILSMKWSAGQDHAVWYRPGAKGYTADINQAGRFDDMEARLYATVGVAEPIRESKVLALAKSVLLLKAECIKQLVTD